MSTVNGVPFRQWLVPSSKYNIKAPYDVRMISWTRFGRI